MPYNSKNFKIMFVDVLKRCGKFLTRLVINLSTVDSEILNLLKKKCPNLQDIDIIFRQDLKNKKDVETLKPIFDKVNCFNCLIGKEIRDKDLKCLFSRNNKLVCFRIYLHYKETCTYFESLPHETIRELQIWSIGTSFDRICDVSLIF